MYHFQSTHLEWVSDDELEAPKEAPQFPEQAPPSPDYVPGPAHPPSPDYVPGPEHPPSPDYIPEPEYPEYLVPSDYEEDLADYHADRGDDDDDGDDDGDSEDEEENLAPADSTTLLVVDPVLSTEDTKALETDEFAPTPTHTSPTYVEAPLGYRAAMIRSRAASPSLVPSPRLHRARISV
ncbi:hypothetical protein Tco_0088711 [Tanacetum coccineum]